MRPKLDFYRMGLAKGDVIRSMDGQTAVICSEGKVIHQGRVVAFAELAGGSAADGPDPRRHWFHGETPLWQLCEALRARG